MPSSYAYIVCTSLRSGSTLLCDLLAATGIAGRPDSFFLRGFFLDWASAFHVSTAGWRGEHEFDQSYLSAVLKEGAGGTRVFGMRLMWQSVADLSKRLEWFYPGLSCDDARFRSAFGPVRYLYLSRNDKIAQAVSLLKAEQSGLWHLHAGGEERERLKPGQTPVYDEGLLSELLATLEDHDRAWKRWFSQQDRQPMCITYEALSFRPRKALAKVLSFLDLDPTAAGKVKPRTAKMANSENREWATRYRIPR